jgi:hypothetical protein
MINLHSKFTNRVAMGIYSVKILVFFLIEIIFMKAVLLFKIKDNLCLITMVHISHYLENIKVNLKMEDLMEKEFILNLIALILIKIQFTKVNGKMETF